MLLRYVVWMFSVVMMVLGADVVSGQNFPNKPIRIVTGGVGGSSDFAVRLIAHGLTVNLGQQAIVDNRSAGIVPGQIVSKAPPDGYTLLLSGATFLTEPLLRSNVPYDVVKDFSPITLAVTFPNVLVVNPSVPVNSVKELIALAKARPGELNYSSSGTGASAHLAAELFKSMAGINIVRVNYKSGGASLNDLIAGQVQLAFATAASVVPHIKSGRLKALAVTTAQQFALFPELPTVAAAGLPGYESGGKNAMFAPAKTPAAIINRLNQEIVRVLNSTDIKERFLNSGVETVASSPEQLAAAMKSEMASLGKIIKDAGIRAD